MALSTHAFYEFLGTKYVLCMTMIITRVDCCSQLSHGQTFLNLTVKPEKTFLLGLFYLFDLKIYEVSM